jgi:hypothetical protein
MKKLILSVLCFVPLLAAAASDEGKPCSAAMEKVHKQFLMLNKTRSVGVSFVNACYGSTLDTMIKIVEDVQDDFKTTWKNYQALEKGDLKRLDQAQMENEGHICGATQPVIDMLDRVKLDLSLKGTERMDNIMMKLGVLQKDFKAAYVRKAPNFGGNLVLGTAKEMRCNMVASNTLKAQAYLDAANSACDVPNKTIREASDSVNQVSASLAKGCK